jgi:transcriptional regulator with XRE-family HTH domain
MARREPKTGLNIGQRLKKIREHSDQTQADMANELGISIPAYANYENDIRVIPLETAMKFCATYRVNLNWLVYGVEENTPSLDLKEMVRASASALFEALEASGKEVPIETIARQIAFVFDQSVSNGEDPRAAARNLTDLLA